MTITTTLVPPSRGGAPATFSADMDAFLAALPTWTTQANALESNVNAKEASATSAATTATTKAGEAATSASNAATSASTASTQASNASTSATNAATSATSASNSASAAAASAASVNLATPGPIGSTTPNSGAFTTLSATGNVTLGDATTDTLNVGNGGIVKDASGLVGMSAPSNGAPSCCLNVAQGVQTQGTAPQWQLYASGAGAGLKYFRVVNDGASGSINFQRVNDAYSVATNVFVIDASNNVLVAGVSGLGYGAGAGGTVTQATSKSTAVTLNKPCGQITMNNAALAAGASVYFSLVNSLIGSADTLAVHPVFFTGTSGNEYEAWVSYLVAGQAVIGVRNNTAGSRSDELLLNFAVIKGSTA